MMTLENLGTRLAQRHLEAGIAELEMDANKESSTQFASVRLLRLQRFWLNKMSLTAPLHCFQRRPMQRFGPE